MRPNPRQTWAEWGQLKKKYLEENGRAYVWMPHNSLGVPIGEMWLIDPKNISVLTRTRGNVKVVDYVVLDSELLSWVDSITPGRVLLSGDQVLVITTQVTP